MHHRSDQLHPVIFRLCQLHLLVVENHASVSSFREFNFVSQFPEPLNERYRSGTHPLFDLTEKFFLVNVVDVNDQIRWRAYQRLPVPQYFGDENRFADIRRPYASENVWSYELKRLLIRNDYSSTAAVVVARDCCRRRCSRTTTIHHRELLDSSVILYS